MDFSKFKLLRVIPEREVDDEEEEEEFDEDEDLEVDYECQWLRRVRYDIVGPGRKIFGQLRFWYIDLDVIRDSFYAEMDIPSSECMEFAFSLFDKNGYLKRKFRREGNCAWGPETDGSMLAYLHEIEIVESQRGKGIGTWALRQIWKVQEQEMVEGLEDINFLFAQPATLSNSADRDLRLNSTQAEFKAAHAPKQARVERFFRKKSYVELKGKERILSMEEEARRNLARREIASNLFPNTTFYPPLSSSPSSSASAIASQSQKSYLFPVRIAEQESKAQQHLHQLALLAISLNRTLVLPNVGGSRLHSCHLFPFAFHYDINSWIERYEGKLSVVEQEEWLRYVEGASTTHSVRSVRLMEGKKAVGVRGEHAGRQKEEDHPLDFSDFCLDKTSSFFEPAQPPVSTFYAPFRYREFDNLALGGFSNGLVSSLSRLSPSPSTDSPIPLASHSIPNFSLSIPIDVLFVDYNLRYPIFPSFLPNSSDLTPPPPPALPPPIELDGSLNDSDTVDPLEEELASPDYNVADYDPFPFLRLLAPSSPPESRQHPFLSFFPMPYSTLWTSLARMIANSLSPYAGVHWRMESVPSSHLSSCATSLARTLDSLREELDPPSTIYLASDYSFDSVLSTSNRSAVAHSLSDTFTDLTSSHRAAASRLIHLLRPSTSLLSGLLPSSFYATRSPPALQTLTTILDSTPSLLPPHFTQALVPLNGNLFELDSGLKGILDKLVLVEADYFFAGSPEKGRGMCGKRSSFTESILDQRGSKKASSTAQSDSEEETTSEVEGETEKVAGIGEPEIEMDSDIVRWFRRPVW
ncbi:hypothetical protein JCM3765_002063 [Sporobolomyces pararoseus]